MQKSPKRIESRKSCHRLVLQTSVDAEEAEAPVNRVDNGKLTNAVFFSTRKCALYLKKCNFVFVS